MKFNELTQRYLKESTGLSKTGLSKKAIKAILGKLSKLAIQIKHDVELEPIRNKKELKLKAKESMGKYGYTVPLIVAVDDKKGEDILIREIGEGSYSAFRYNRDSEEIEEFNRLSLAKAVSLIPTSAKLYFEDDAAIGLQLKADRRKNKEALDPESNKWKVDLISVLDEKYSKAFAKEIKAIGEKRLKEFTELMLENPDSRESDNLVNAARLLLRKARRLENHSGIFGIISYINKYKPEYSIENDIRSTDSIKERENKAKIYGSKLLKLLKSAEGSNLFNDAFNDYNARDVFNKNKLYEY